MRKFTKDEIKRFESGSIYEAEVLEGAVSAVDEPLLLESVDEDAKKKVKSAFGGKSTTKIDESENGEAMKEAFTGKPVYEAPKGKREPTENDVVEIREAFGGKTPDLEEALSPEELLQETVTIDEIMEGEGGFRFKGRAVRVDRKNKNKRRYGKGITEGALKEARDSGITLTVRDGHPKKGETAVTPIVGKVVFGDLREDGWMPYSATISNTSRGMDIQKLLRDKCIGDVSLRSKGHTAVAKEDGEAFEDVVDLHFRGLDLVTEGSETGAKVDEIFNSA